MQSGPLRRLADFARSLRRERDVAGQLLLALIALHVAAVIALGASPAATRWFMRRFQLDDVSFPAWALYVAGPWMYNFENQVLVSPSPLSRSVLTSQALPLDWWYINHQPARVVTFGDHRPLLLRTPGEHYVYLRSRYRDTEQLRGLRVRVSAGAKPYRAWLEPLEVGP